MFVIPVRVITDSQIAGWIGRGLPAGLLPTQPHKIGEHNLPYGWTYAQFRVFIEELTGIPVELQQHWWLPDNISQSGGGPRCLVQPSQDRQALADVLSNEDIATEPATVYVLATPPLPRPPAGAAPALPHSLLFLKALDPVTGALSYAGSLGVYHDPGVIRLKQLHLQLTQQARLPLGCPIAVYVELGTSHVPVAMEDTLRQARISSGAILCIMRAGEQPPCTPGLAAAGAAAAAHVEAGASWNSGSGTPLYSSRAVGPLQDVTLCLNHAIMAPACAHGGFSSTGGMLPALAGFFDDPDTADVIITCAPEQHASATMPCPPSLLKARLLARAGRSGSGGSSGSDWGGSGSSSCSAMLPMGSWPPPGLQASCGSLASRSGSANMLLLADGSGSSSNCGAMSSDDSLDEAAADSSEPAAAGTLTYHCHRLVLAAHSPVLAAMVVGPMREATSRRITLHAADAHTAAAFLQLLYGSSVTLPLQQLLPLYALGDQYGVTSVCQVVLSAIARTARCDAAACMSLYLAARQLGAAPARLVSVKALVGAVGELATCGLHVHMEGRDLRDVAAGALQRFKECEQLPDSSPGRWCSPSSCAAAWASSDSTGGGSQQRAPHARAAAAEAATRWSTLQQQLLELFLSWAAAAPAARQVELPQLLALLDWRALPLTALRTASSDDLLINDEGALQGMLGAVLLRAPPPPPPPPPMQPRPPSAGAVTDCAATAAPPLQQQAQQGANTRRLLHRLLLAAEAAERCMPECV